MANIKDCLGFETFGADVKEARKVKQLSRKTLAEQVNSPGFSPLEKLPSRRPLLSLEISPRRQGR